MVCGPSILSHSDVVHRVQEALGGRESGLFSGIAPHSPVEVLYEAVAMARELEPDALVSVGGGSTSDTCKGIAMMLAEGGDLHDYEVRFQPPDLVIVPDLPHQKIPLIAVPTTLGAAELSTGGGGFTDKKLGRKVLISGQGTLPKTILVDGRALATTPMPIMLSTAIGQFRIAVEGIYSTGHHPIADALALHTIKMLVEYLPPMPWWRCRLPAPCQNGGVHGHAGPARSGIEHRYRPSIGRALRRAPRRGPTQSCCPTPCGSTWTPVRPV